MMTYEAAKRAELDNLMTKRTMHAHYTQCQSYAAAR